MKQDTREIPIVREVEEMLRLGESSRTEFKEGFGQKVIVALNAFANTDGGSVLVGVANDGKVKGLSVGDETVQEWINEIKQKTEPAIVPDAERVRVAGKEVVLFSVKEYPIKPIAVQGRYFKRAGNANHQLSAAEVSDLYLRSMRLSWDAYPSSGATFGDLDLTKVDAFLQKVQARGRFGVKSTPKETLQKLGLIKDELPTNAAMILFGQKNLGYDVHAGRLKTADMILDDRIIRGSLFDVLDETMSYIIGHLKVAYEIVGTSTQRVEIFEYPLPAVPTATNREPETV